MLRKPNISEAYRCTSKIILFTYSFIVDLGFLLPSVVIYSDTDARVVCATLLVVYYLTVRFFLKHLYVFYLLPAVHGRKI